jgi:hypothetical protein
MMLPTDPLQWAITTYREDSRNRSYRIFQQYADGEQGGFKSPVEIPKELRPTYDAVTYNRCASVIDAMADRIMVEGFNEAGGGSAQDAINLWHENRMDKREGEVNQEALTAGDGYVIVWPHPISGRPTIWPQNADQLRVLYDEEQPGLVTLATKMWKRDDNYIQLNVYLPDRLEKYITMQPYRSGALPRESNDFERYQPDGDLTWPLRYDWYRDQLPSIPVFHFANNARTGQYGRSELKDVIPLQDGLNNTLAITMVVTGQQGFPLRHVEGYEPETDLATGQKKQLSVPIGGILGFPDANTKVGQFDAAQLQQLISVGESFDLMISRVSRVPVHYLGLTSNFPSGESLKTADAPFVAKLDDRARAFGNVWEDVMTLALRMAGVEITYELEAVYASTAPRSEMEELQAAILKKQVGFSTEEILRDLGKSDKDIAQMQADKQAAIDRAQAAFDAGTVGNPDFGNQPANQGAVA